MKLPTAPMSGIYASLRQAAGYQAELRHSQPGVALTSFAVIHLAIHPCGGRRVFWRRRMNPRKESVLSYVSPRNP